MKDGFGHATDVCDGKALAVIGVEGGGFSLGAAEGLAGKVEKFVSTFTEVATVFHAHR